MAFISVQPELIDEQGHNLFTVLGILSDWFSFFWKPLEGEEDEEAAEAPWAAGAAARLSQSYLKYSALRFGWRFCTALVLAASPFSPKPVDL